MRKDLNAVVVSMSTYNFLSVIWKHFLLIFSLIRPVLTAIWLHKNNSLRSNRGINIIAQKDNNCIRYFTFWKKKIYKLIIIIIIGNFKRETESLLIAAQDSAIRTNHIKARIDKTQQNSKCRRCGDRNETINHIISKCSKLAQREYKARYDWVGKVIHWEMCKKLKFDHTNKWYKHNPAPVLENATHKLLWDFNIQTDHLIPVRRPDLIIINKKENLKNSRLCCPGWPQNKTERMWKKG